MIVYIPFADNMSILLLTILDAGLDLDMTVGYNAKLLPSLVLNAVKYFNLKMTRLIHGLAARMRKHETLGSVLGQNRKKLPKMRFGSLLSTGL